LTLGSTAQYAARRHDPDRPSDRAPRDGRALRAVTRPIGVLFIPCRDGCSHCPEEWADVDHLATGARVLPELLLRLDRDLA
jgi:acetylornithine deacetylase/succinyl-diaminopimelate desuccinylase-like protein